MRLSVLSVFASLTPAICAVIEATDATIQGYIDSGIPTLLSIHAPWCGHCKTFGPQFDELAKEYEHASKKIQFVRIDGDSNRKTAKKYNVQYFPTLKLVTGKKQQDVENRQIPALKDLIKTKTGVDAKPAAAQPGSKGARRFVKSLTDTSIDKAIDGKHALVAFTATWCGHCKTLKPEWEKLAELYANDKDIVIGSVDCTDGAGKNLVQKHGIKGFPTIIYYPKDGSKPVTYSGSRKMQSFAEYLKDEGASERESTGFLSNSAGIIPELKQESAKLIGASEEFAAALVSKIEASGSKYVKQYLKFIPKIIEGGEKYIKGERKRLQKLLKGKVNHQTRDNIKIRMNILRSFLPSKDDAKEDL